MTEYTEEQLLEEIRERAENMSEDRIFFSLRKMKIKRIHPMTVNIIKYVLAIDETGLPITTKLIEVLTGKDVRAVILTLHALGDKKIVNLIRGSAPSSYYRWFVTEIFKNTYNPPKEPEQVEAI